ncbi:hypothetical protein LQD23_16300 [Chromobacterium violaceum]|uniref:Gp49 family protein n=1 Tax=Chromobacterium violaceum TaxID=536 RepID=UPI001E59755B|nr:Gp49 family protein [Chromobacterium violaceum]MCD0493843.1 hypothetical protein [Chromobacterium violaceum]
MDLEQQIQDKGLTAPRVTMADIEVEISSEHYFTAADGVVGNEEVDSPCSTRDCIQLGLLTFCVLVLRNGFTVTGESACASPENFNAEIGKKIAREKAISKVWPLLGYQLRTIITNREQMPPADTP